MLQRVSDKVLSGVRMTGENAIALFHSDDLFALGKLASHMAEKRHGKKAYFIRNRHINPTNICVNRCRFCAFSRSKGQDGAYELTIKEIINKLKDGQGPEGKGQGKYRTLHRSRITHNFFSEVHIVGGLHPDWPFTYYLELLSTIKEHFPKLHIKAFTAVEIDHFSKISGLGLEETLTALKRCGLGS